MARSGHGLELQGTRAACRKARPVFEGALAGHLRRRGATSASKMVGPFGWFWIRLSEAEVYEVLEAARRDGLVAPLGHEERADGSQIKVEEWALTETGRRLETVRTLNPRDLWLNLSDVGRQSGKIENGAKRTAAILAPIAPGIGVLLGVNPWTVCGVSAVIVAFLIASGLQGEAAIGKAAEVWPRLKVCRPAVYEWMMLRGDKGVPAVAVVAIAVYLLAAGVLLKWKGEWDFDPTFAGAVFVAALGVVCLVFRERWLERRRKYRAFVKERDRVDQIRKHEPGNCCGPGHECLAVTNGVSQCPEFGEANGKEPGGGRRQFEAASSRPNEQQAVSPGRT